MKLDLLVHGTEFTYKGRILRKTVFCGPCDPQTNKALFAAEGANFVLGVACAPKMGGQFQEAEELQVWVPKDAEVDVQINQR